MAVCAGLVIAGHLFVSHRPDLGYDAKFYVAMIRGEGATVPGPFRFRLLVPFVASLLPFSPTTSLLLISYLSLFGMYLLIVRACELVGLTLRDAVFGLLAIWGSTWHLYHYYNPYMTDAFALACIGVMLLAMLRDGFAWFAAAAVVGAMGRETTAFLAPAWFVTRQATRTVILLAAIGVIVLLPRYWLASNADVALAGALNGSGTVFLSTSFARQLLAIWGVVWLTGMAGVWLLPDAYRNRVAVSLALMFAGALAASSIATDTGRMFGFLAPVLAVGSARFYALARRDQAMLAWALAVLIALQGLFNTPDVMFDRDSWLVGWPRRVFTLVEFALVLSILTRLRGSGGREVKQVDSLTLHR